MNSGMAEITNISDRVSEKTTLVVETYCRLLERNGYCNSGKICALFKFWLKDFWIGLKLDRKTPEKCLFLLVYYSLDDNIYFTRKTENYGNSIVDNLKKLCWRILSFFPIYRGIFSGAINGKISSFISNILFYKLKFEKPGVNDAMKNQFFSEIEKYLSPSEMLKLRRAIPDEFFLNEWNAFVFPRIFFGSAFSLYDENCIKALFIKKKITFVGFQHGGFYGELKDNRCEDLEKEFSNEFYHWGLGERNIIQNRYKIERADDKVLKKIFLVGSVKPNEFIASYFPGIRDMYDEARDNIAATVNTLSRSKKVGYLKHPRYLDPIASDYETVVVQKYLPKDELQSTLLIFDKPGQTMLYQSVYQCRPFILYYNRRWNCFFTDKFKYFLKELEKNKLLYYWDQENEFVEQIGKLFDSGYSKRNFQTARLVLERGIKTERAECINQ